MGEQALCLECDTDTGVLEADRKDALVDLVELHQLQQVYEQSQTVVYGEVLPASLLTLQRRGQPQLGCTIHLSFIPGNLLLKNKENSQGSPGSVWSVVGNTVTGQSTVRAAGCHG